MQCLTQTDRQTDTGSQTPQHITKYVGWAVRVASVQQIRVIYGPWSSKRVTWEKGSEDNHRWAREGERRRRGEEREREKKTQSKLICEHVCCFCRSVSVSPFWVCLSWFITHSPPLSCVGSAGASVCTMCQAGTYWTGSGRIQSSKPIHCCLRWQESLSTLCCFCTTFASNYLRNVCISCILCMYCSLSWYHLYKIHILYLILVSNVYFVGNIERLWLLLCTLCCLCVNGVTQEPWLQVR